MKLVMKNDTAKLQASLKKYSKMFGENSAQAVTRWGVQTGRELAFYTQAYGKVGTKKKQITAITADAKKVVNILARASKKLDLQTAEECVDWINENRVNRQKRVRRLKDGRKTVSLPNFRKAIKMKSVSVGKAKGSWLGAAMDVAKRQKGTNRINIGKNYLGYAQKWASGGKGIAAQNGFSPSSKLTSFVDYVSDKYVLKKRDEADAVNLALKNTVKWYRKALKTADKNNK